MKKRRISYLHSFQGRINQSLLLIVGIAVLSFMIISINQTNQTVKNTSAEYTSQLIQMVNENIEDYIGNMENIAHIVTGNSDVRNFLYTVNDDETVHNTYSQKVAEQFKTLKETRNDIYNIGILGSDGRYMINDRYTVMNMHADLEGQEWYYKAKQGQEVISSSHVQNIVENEYHWVVTLSREIPNLVKPENNGVFFVDLNYSSISNLCEEINLGTKGYVFILDDQGNLVYHPKQQLIYSGLWEENLDTVMNATEKEIYSPDGTRLFTISKSEKTGWTVVGVTYMDEMLSGTKRIRVMYYLMAVILIGVAFLLSILLSDMITMPLRKLRESMKSVENGNFELEIEEPQTGDEISDLFRSFKIMVLKIQQLMEHGIQEQREKRKMELNALQAQINPHFLYNTLDSIIWMAEDGDTRDVVLMTSALARLLRKSISNKNETVMLSEEIEYTRSYLTIQKMRYKDKLEYEIDVDSSIHHAEIVKLIVQPLVENSIYHGIKNKENGKGMVRIEGRYEDDEIVIRISDNGVGMTPEQLQHVFDDRVIDTKRNGVGVQNVQHRIQLYYGADYGLSFESEKNVGTTVTIRLPDTMLTDNSDR